MNSLESISLHHHEDDNFLLSSYSYGRKAKDLIKGTAILWTSGNTFRNLCDMMVLYVTGLLPTSPSHTGPILSETTGISSHIAQCNRNGLLTTSSEPVQVDYNIHTGEQFTVDNANIEIYVREHNYIKLMSALEAYGDRFKIQDLNETKLDYVFGPMYKIAAKDVKHIGIIDTKVGSNDMYLILVNISKEFTEFM